ncbi:MAG: hypothetical protein ATN36_06475 [Epulopiscium sp. Nele67-Bin005]|nr:MAG: hypothetical protein ATN36_06475 [Epulopiscium sp. Nele67-Bin005]
MLTKLQSEFLDFTQNTPQKLELANEQKLVNAQSILDFKNLCNKLNHNYEDILNTERMLRIGIVGEVKAGKSSFVNATIFDGEQVLPQAATPMTAALTKIVYSENEGANVVFYEKYDWDTVVELANLYDTTLEDFIREETERQKQNQAQKQDLKEKAKTALKSSSSNTPAEVTIDIESLKKDIPKEYVSCKELVDMANKNRLNIYEILGTSQEIDLNNLDNYVGANGKFTPVVKHIELRLNNPLLKNFEIIDTPGLNDPILSRSDATRTFLSKCDAVFMVCYSGQFLTNEDIKFLTNTLPSDNIQKAILVGSKIDSAVRDTPIPRNGSGLSFKQALRHTVTELNNQAQSNIDMCIKSNSPAHPVLTTLKNSLPPEYVSSLMYEASKRLESNRPLTDAQQNVIEGLNKFTGFNTSPTFLKEFSNIENVKNKHFEEIKATKEDILLNKRGNLFGNTKSHLISKLEDIKTEAMENKANINKYDVEDLETKRTTLITNLNSARHDIKNTFEGCHLDAQQYLRGALSDIKSTISMHTVINVEREHRQKTSTSKSGGILGPIFNQTTTTTTDIITYSANVHDVIGNIRNNVNKAEQDINNSFIHAINIKGMTQKIKTIIINLFDLTDPNFNEREILGPIENALKRIVMPEINLPIEKYNEFILSSFSGGTVHNEDIGKLQLKQDKVIQKITTDVQQLFHTAIADMENALTARGATLVDDITNQIITNIDNLQRQLKNKEQSLAFYDEFVKELNHYKTTLLQMEV